MAHSGRSLEDSSIPRVSTVLLASSLVASLSNVGVSLLISPAEQHFASIFLSNVAATLLLVLAFHAALWFLIGKPVVVFFSLTKLPVVIALCFAAITLFILFPLVQYSHSNAGELFCPISLLVAFLVPCITVLAYFSALSWITSDNFSSRSSALMLSLPSVALLTVWFLWTLQVRINILEDATHRPTPAFWIALILYLLLIVAAWKAVQSLSGTVNARTILILGMLAIVASPFVPFLAEHRDALGTGGPSTPNDGIRHVLLITVDTLRADVIGAPARQGGLTPSLDELASDSVVFLNARSPSPWTKPAMASILTGLSPLVHGAVSPRSSLGKGVPTLAQILREKGYVTAAIGRNSNLSSIFNFAQGFDSYRMYLGSAVQANPSAGSWFLEWSGLTMVRPSTDKLARAAKSWINRHHDKPFFLWIHFFDPHAPYSPPREWLPNPRAGEANFNSFDSSGQVRDGSKVLSAAEKRRIRELYEAEVQYVDRAVGDLLSVMRQRGLYRGSLIVFASDHGEEFFEHGSIGHGHTLYDEVLKVPLMVKLPQSQVTRTVEATVSTESITPTILQFTNVRVDPKNFSSPSLTSFLKPQGAGQSPTPVVSAGMLSHENRLSIIFDNWKYIHYLDSDDEELYSLDEDPRELHSVAQSNSQALLRAQGLLASYMDQVASLSERLKLEEAEDPELRKDVLEDLKALGYLQ